MPVSTPSPARRRLLLAGLGASLAGAGPRLSLAGQAGPQDKRLVLLILRGALDGLAAVPALGDPGHADARGPLAQFNTAALPLDSLFAMHPLLPQMHQMYGAGELAVLHAVGMPYQERSHFDAQMLLESGGQHPADLTTGWLGRALALGDAKAMAFQPTVPLALRGHAAVDTWTPPSGAGSQVDGLAELSQRLLALYAHDPALAQAMGRAQQLHGPGMAGMDDKSSTMAAAGPNGAASRAAELARQAAKFLARADGPQAAVLELGGWDSHANQVANIAGAAGGGGPGALGGPLQSLDAMLAALRQGLTAPGSADTWARTVVLVVTEFGRTVAMNGTRGTDHGSAGAAFVLGGAVKGGQVLADWPGLAVKDRVSGRDLRPTTDLRALFKTVLHQHLGLPLADIGSRLLPGSQTLAMLPLLRA